MTKPGRTSDTRTKVHLVQTTQTDNVELVKIEVGNEHDLRLRTFNDARMAAWFRRFVGVAIGGVAIALYVHGDVAVADKLILAAAVFLGGLGYKAVFDKPSA